ncbi:MAG: VOC family protein [Bacteroidota bacterium]
MIKQFWINLPVKNISKSKEFFTRLGFKFRDEKGLSPGSACLMIGECNTVCMLFEEQIFKSFINNEVADTGKSTEVLLSIDAQSREEVDEMAEKAIAAGGASNHKPGIMSGPMYGCVFSDPDGHLWNVLYMDMGKMPAE